MGQAFVLLCIFCGVGTIHLLIFMHRRFVAFKYQKIVDNNEFWVLVKHNKEQKDEKLRDRSENPSPVFSAKIVAYSPNCRCIMVCRRQP